MSTIQKNEAHVTKHRCIDKQTQQKDKFLVMHQVIEKHEHNWKSQQDIGGIQRYGGGGLNEAIWLFLGVIMLRGAKHIMNGEWISCGDRSKWGERWRLV